MEQRARFLGQHPGSHLTAISQPGVVKQVESRSGRPLIGTGGGEHHSLEASLQNGPSAHRTGLQGHVEGGATKAPISHALPGLLEGLDLSVAKGALERLAAVAPLAEKLLLADHQRSHRYFTLFESLAGQLERSLHPIPIFFLGAHLRT